MEVKIILMILWVITLCIFWVVNNVSDNHSTSNFKTDQMSQHWIHFNFTYLLTYSMEQSPSWKANWFCS